MNVRQSLSVLFFPKKQNTDSGGNAPIYVRITIDGLRDEFSTGLTVRAGEWNVKTKTVSTSTPGHKTINKQLGQIKADMERHFDLVQAKHGLATPEAVKRSYQTPINGNDQHRQKVENLEFSEELDNFISEYILLCKKVKRDKENGRLSPEKLAFYQLQKQKFKKTIEPLIKRGREIFNDKNRRKTLVLAIDEYLLDFLQLAIVGERSENTLEKWAGRKNRYIQFLNYQFKAADIPLVQLEFSFLNDLTKYLMMHHECSGNTAMKYAQCIKETMERAVSLKWISANIFSSFRCSYSDNDMKWLELHQLSYFAEFEFSKPKYNVIRDIYTANSFLGFAYADLHAAVPEDIFIGMDGEKWIRRNRQKTSVEEAIPLLPIVVKILEHYKNNPICARKNRLLPVPSNAEYNRCLKEMGNEIGLQLLTEKGKGTHRTRYFVANVVLNDNGVPLKTTGKILGQKSIRTTEKYVRPNKKNVSENMQMVKQKLFDIQGNLKVKATSAEMHVNEEIAVNNISKVIYMERR